MTSESRSSVAAWKRCSLCVDLAFKTPQEFRLHLRKNHCKKEGGSYVCCYGKNNICGSLPLEGVSDQDYEFHVVKHHVLTFTSKYVQIYLCLLKHKFEYQLIFSYFHILDIQNYKKESNCVCTT